MKEEQLKTNFKMIKRVLYLQLSINVIFALAIFMLIVIHIN